MKLLKIFKDSLNRRILYWVLTLLVVFDAGFLVIYFNSAFNSAALMATIGYAVVMLMVIFFVTLMDDA